MSYLTMFIAWLQMQNSGLSDHAWSWAFWNKVLALNIGAYHLSWWIWGVFLVAAVLFGVITIIRHGDFKGCLGCFGCGGIILLLLPLGAWINLIEIRGIVNSINANAGIVNTMNFYISLALFLFFGIF